jgi:hypothetical protein
MRRKGKAQDPPSPAADSETRGHKEAAGLQDEPLGQFVVTTWKVVSFHGIPLPRRCSVALPQKRSGGQSST